MSTETTTDRISDLNSEIEAIEKEIEPLNRQLGWLGYKLIENKSVLFIEENNIRRSDVQMSQGEGVPYFLIANRFIEWMNATRCSKPWTEWNGLIYRTSELMEGRMFATPGMVKHLRGE